MAVLLFAKRKGDLIRLQYQYQQKLNDIVSRIADLSQYAANVGDGSMSIFNMMNCPASMFDRTLMYTQLSHNCALNEAQARFQQMQAAGVLQPMQGADPNMQAQYMQYVQQSLYQQARERFAKQEQAHLNAQEKKLMQEKEKIESQLAMIKNELQSCKEGEKAGIEQWKPTYA